VLPWPVTVLFKLSVSTIETNNVNFYNKEGIVQIIFTLMCLYYYIRISNVICPGLYCLFCWYWYNCSPSYLKLSFHNHISHRIVENKKEYWLNMATTWKIEWIWNLQMNKTCQVIECAWLDWCNLIGIQLTTKYKIHTKYDDNLRLPEYRKSEDTICVTYQNQHAKGQRSPRERTKGKQ
jgi:hypothetical protein